jgi:hypothetical protein
MKKILLAFLLLLFAPLIAQAQISGAGNIGCTGVAVSGTVINSGTANNTVVFTVANTAAWGVLVQLDQTTTITAGAVTFLSSGDGTTYVAVPVAQVLNPSTFAQLTNPYTLVPSTNQQFLIILNGASNFEVKLTTAMTGTGAITPYVTAVCTAPPTLQLNSSGAVKVDGSAVTQPVSGTVTTTPPSNASTNIAQVAGASPAVTNPLDVALADGTNGPAAVKAASTAAVAADKAIVVAVSPNNTPVLPSGAAASANQLPSTSSTNAATTFENDAVTTTATVKSSAGNVYGYFVYNPNSSVCYLEFFNTTSPTLGTTAPIFSLGIPATSGANLFSGTIALGQFGTAIGVAATTASKGATTCTTGMTVTIWYQ